MQNNQMSKDRVQFGCLQPKFDAFVPSDIRNQLDCHHGRI